jgi:hypothetical protein
MKWGWPEWAFMGFLGLTAFISVFCWLQNAATSDGYRIGRNRVDYVADMYCDKSVSSKEFRDIIGPIEIQAAYSGIIIGMRRCGVEVAK